MRSSLRTWSEGIELAGEAARRSGARRCGAEDRGRYFAVVDGLSYGDNPADGLIRGRRFVHPRLGVAFEAPEGVGLENTSKAVLGASPDGSRRLLFDAIEAAEGQTLEAVLQSAWNDSVETGSVQALTVNGLPAAVATARGKEWLFRLAAIRVGATTYRLVLASRGQPEALERAFRASLDSIRPLTAEETRGVRPLRLQLVAAGQGDTGESFAPRLPLPNPAGRRFLVLNGLERGARPKPGERYKIIAE